MIEKMKFVSITGPNDDIDRVINTYLSKYEIHLENPMLELESANNLSPYVETNPYKDFLTKSNDLISYLDNRNGTFVDTLNVERSCSIIDELTTEINNVKDKITKLTKLKNDLQVKHDKILPFVGLNYDISSILKFKHIKYRFGRIPKDFFGKVESYMENNNSSIFEKCVTDDEYVWGVYFVPAAEEDKIDATYTSMHFERTYVPSDAYGTPEKACKALQKKIDDYAVKIEGLNEDIKTLVQNKKNDILTAYDKIKTAFENFDVRKMATHTKNDGVIFYIICGWMTKKDAYSFFKEIETDDDVVCIIEDESSIHHKTPPTKIKNPKIFKPFEMYVKMYGLPAYNEIDPTIFVAMTYAFIFGAMFGDVGQGLLLVVAGFLLYYFKKIDLAAIIGTCGIFSTFFGFMFGSIFGFEDIIDAVWLRPVDSMSKVPFIGKLNTVFVVAIGFGMFIILTTMVFHIINGIKTKDTENIFFDTNALAGLVFYGSVVAIVGLLMAGKKGPAGIALAVLFIIPLLLIALKEPLTHLITKTKPKEKTSVGMFITQTFFELFEVLLSYFSNTLSFIRIGAFAVSHASMMAVVLMLAGAENGSPNWVVIILGNLFVVCMEGLIVGIQVLRLVYYEMFSRFYKGNGREFKPFKHIKHLSNEK